MSRYRIDPERRLPLESSRALSNSGASRSATTSMVMLPACAYDQDGLEAYTEGNGVCRGYAHLAIAFCCCMNIPARYCTGYLGDIGIPPPYGPMDFAAWFEAYLGGRWYTFDARNNILRIGRILIGQGRVRRSDHHTFGPNTLIRFRGWTDEVVEASSSSIEHDHLIRP